VPVISFPAESISMGFLNWLSGLLASSPAKPPPPPPAGTRTIAELATRLRLNVRELTTAPITYQQFEIPKRRKGKRKILAPVHHLKTIQRQILRRILGGLKPHPCATGFCRGHSIVTNALPHLGKAVIVRMDLKDFFPTTTAWRVNHYFRFIGWNAEAADLLTRLCTHNGCLPQGAPTSPKLSNLLNHHLDARLFGLAGAVDASYTRYADDITYSLQLDDPVSIRKLVHMTSVIAREEGYLVHQREKLYIRRKKDRQVVTGLVVNERINLPRKTRRWLRAVEHHQQTGRKTSISKEQLDGWRSLQSMIQWQSGASENAQEKPA